MANDGGGGPAGAIQTAGTGGRQPLDKLDLPYGAQLDRAIRAVHRTGLNKHGGAHVVAAVNIGGQLVEEIPLVGDTIRATIPEVVMGIADGQLRLQGRFLGESQPVIASVWHTGTSIAECRGASSPHGRRAPVAMRHKGVAVFPALPDSIARNPVPNNLGEPPRLYETKWYKDYHLPSPTFNPQKRHYRVVYLQRAGKCKRPTWRPSQGQKGLDERALTASAQAPSSGGFPPPLFA